MKHHFLLLKFLVMIACILVGKNVFSQKQYNTWYFGNHAGITFNATPPAALLDGKLTTYESSSGICDKKGNLLFYTNGDTIWNKDHQIMKNGIPPEFYAHESSFQGSVVVKKPGNNNQYYIFCTPAMEMPVNHYLKYWVIDMDLDGGKGAAIIVNKLLLPHSDEGMAIAKHANQKDFWIGAVNKTTGDFNCVRTVNGEIDTNIITTRLDGYVQGQSLRSLKFSPDAEILYAYSNFELLPGPSFFSLYHFDNATGKIYDQIKVPCRDGVGWSQEFSHDSKIFYITSSMLTDLRQDVFQYDLSHWNIDSIVRSETMVLSDSIYGLQLGPDKKIYVFNFFSHSLSVINAPYQKGLDCDVQRNIISLGDRTTSLGGPYFPTCMMEFDPSVKLGDDTILCTGDTLLLGPDAVAGYRYRWNTGDTAEKITVRDPGQYFVTVYTASDTMYSDTVIVKYGVPFKVYLGSDTTFCGKFSHILNAGKSASGYLWNTGDTTYSITVTTPGVFAVAVTDSNSCKSGDTIRVDQLTQPKLSLVYDSVTCAYVTIDAGTTDPGLTYLWNTGDTTSSIRVFNTGIYSVKVSNSFCSMQASVPVNKLAIPENNLGADTSVCEVDPLLLAAKDNGTYEWSTGESSSKIYVQQPGIYWLKTTRNHCSSVDSIILAYGCDKMSYYIPNAFTPNGDLLNDVFEVHGINIGFVSMQIINRWGEIIYTAEGKSCSWNGISGSRICPSDVYIYRILLKGGTRETVLKTGSITLIR